MPPRVHLFHGDDGFALAEARKKLEAAVLDPAWRDFNLTTLGPEASAGQAVAAVMTVPFGGGDRLVVVKDAPYLAAKAEEGLAELEALLERGMPPTAHLLFLAPKVDGRLKLVKAIAAAGEVREFGAVKSWEVERQLKPWVRTLANERQRRIDDDAISALLAVTGGDRWRVQREIEKLAVAASEGSPISLGLVNELVAGGDVQVFAVTDALARKDTGAAMTAIGKLLVGQHALQVLAVIVTIVRNWARMKGLAERKMSNDDIARALGFKGDGQGFRVSKDLEKVRGWKAAELAAALDVLLDVDLAIKEGRWPPDSHRVLLERAVARMITPAGRGIV